RATVARLEAEQSRLLADRRNLSDARQGLLAEEIGLVATLEEVRLAGAQLASRAASLRELEARYEGCTRGVSSLVAADPDATILLASVLRVPAGLERAVAAALGARLGQVIVPDTAAAVRAIGWLRDTSGGSATVVPRDPERRATVIVPPG